MRQDICERVVHKKKRSRDDMLSRSRNQNGLRYAASMNGTASLALTFNILQKEEESIDVIESPQMQKHSDVCGRCWSFVK